MQRILAIAIVIFSLSFFGGAAVAVEEPPFRSVTKDNQFEIRDYPALVVAEVTVSGEQKEAGNKGFRLLAAYIFGANTRKQGSAVAAAALQQESDEKIPMTAPVTQSQQDGQWVVRFTMPSGYSLNTLPEPKDARIHLRSLQPARFAVIEFSGLAYPDDVAARTLELSAWIDQHHLRVTGPPSLAQYNPPWTLWFLRRNEILIEVEH